MSKMPPSFSHRPQRHNEWTRAKMAAFLGELAATLSVSRAARSVGMGRQSAYKLRKRSAPFAAAWDEVVADLPRTSPPAPFTGPRACPLCGAAPGRATARNPG